MAPATLILATCDQPVAFDRLDIGQQRRIGRANLLDDADSAQNRDPAALPATRAIGPISK